VLNRLQESGKIKGDVYWPCLIGETKQFGDVLVTFDSNFVLPKFDIEIRRFNLENRERTSKRRIFQICYEGWPDFGVPSSSVAIRELIHLVRFFRQWGLSKHLDGPCVVHCSAGIGRSGTFLGIMIALETTFRHFNPKEFPKEDKIPSDEDLNHPHLTPTYAKYSKSGGHNSVKHKSRKTKDCNRGHNPKLDSIVDKFEIFDIVLSLRQQRNRGTVQTVNQYEFIYQTLQDEIDRPLLVSSAIQQVREWQCLRHAEKSPHNSGKYTKRSLKRPNSTNPDYLPPSKRGSGEGMDSKTLPTEGTQTDPNFLVHLEDQFKENLCLDVCC